MLALDEHSVAVDGSKWHRCANLSAARCNWLAADDDELCRSCRLTRTRPADTDIPAMEAFAEAETAKRRVVLQVLRLGLPIAGRDTDAETGLCFDLLASRAEHVVTGHAAGVITLDLAESDDVHREQLRVSMDEPYRTLVGHFRHEIGHYYQPILTREHPERFESLFGDPASDYRAALDRYYRTKDSVQWQDQFISAYASMHPTEDWAETFAHYLHIRETLDTAAAFAMAPADATLEAALPGAAGFERIIEWWLPLSWSLNQINRSMGHIDLYPFVLPAPVLDKMRAVHELITGLAA